MDLRLYRCSSGWSTEGETSPGRPIGTQEPQGSDPRVVNLIGSEFGSLDDTTACNLLVGSDQPLAAPSTPPLAASQSHDAHAADIGLCYCGQLADPTPKIARAATVAKQFSSVSSTPSLLQAPDNKVRGGAIVLGICCMAKKMHSNTMQAMLAKFEASGLFHLFCFPEPMIVDDPVSVWPKVDVMILFFSAGFPLEKGIEYARRHPDTFYVTHPESQQVLLDRRDFYSALKRNNVPMVRSVSCSRDGYRGQPQPVLVENLDEEWIVVNGERICKPFVEKPVDSEDHNVYIYYDRKRGGGCRMLFRKKGDQSSEYDPKRSAVRRDGSYVYEEFIETDGMMDVKCYTVGPNFVHAERRKAPTVDGIVLRSASGKEVRQSVALTPDEMTVARKVIKIFRQMVCGFDILRGMNGRFFVCDVNGWSFVKNNEAYVERATKIMQDLFVEEVRKRGLHRVFAANAQMALQQLQLPPANEGDARDVQFVSTAHSSTSSNSGPIPRRLVGVVGVLRHADRTPKQKVKIVVNTEVLLEMVFDGCGAERMRQELVYKSGHPMLDKICSCASQLLDEIDSSEVSSRSSNEVSGTIARRRNITFHAQAAGENPTHPVAEQLRLIVGVMSRSHEGLKVQIRPSEWDENGKCTEALLICKWGGWLTEAGHKQAEMLGNHFIRRIFGAEPSEHCISKGQLSIHTNNERRVIFTGVDFARCMMHDQQLTEAVCIVDEPLLGSCKYAKNALDHISKELRWMLHVRSPAELSALKDIPGIQSILQCPVLDEQHRTPRGALDTLHRLMVELVEHIPGDDDDHVPLLYRDEPLHLMRQRWSTLTKAFFNKKSDMYDTTKIPDIFDNVSYDVCYNQEALAPLDMYPLFTLCEVLSAFASDAEYGIQRESKRLTGCLIGTPLLCRISDDLHQLSKGETPRTRLYFTSESHVMALKNMLYHQEETQFHRLGEPMELHFLTHFVFKLYHYGDADTYQLEVHFSSGIDQNMFGIVQEHHVGYSAVTPMIRIHNDLTLPTLQSIVDKYKSEFQRATGASPSAAE